MTEWTQRAVEAVIEWAVEPAAPLPPVGATAAAAAFMISLRCGPRPQSLAVRALLVAIGIRRPGPLLARLDAGPLAPLGEALAALAQLAYYGEPTVLEALGYRPGAA